MMETGFEAPYHAIENNNSKFNIPNARNNQFDFDEPVSNKYSMPQNIP